MKIVKKYSVFSVLYKDLIKSMISFINEFHNKWVVTLVYNNPGYYYRVKIKFNNQPNPNPTPEKCRITKGKWYDDPR